MPNHCYWADQYPAYQDIDFSVNWNMIPMNSTKLSSPDLVCNQTSTADSMLPAQYGYTKVKGDMDLITGIAVTGTAFMTSLSSSNLDQVYAPKGSNSTSEPTDDNLFSS